MAVAHDASSEAHTSTTASTSQAQFTWTHTPVGTPRGVAVFVWRNNATFAVTSVLYGIAGLSLIGEATAIDNAGEPGRVDVYFLGRGIPTGPQTVEVNRTNDAVAMSATCVTVTAAADTEIYLPGIVLVTGDSTVAQQSVTDGSPGTNSLRYAAGHFGHQTLPTQGANSTALQNIDIGASGFVTVRETTAGQGSRSVGMTSGTSDDRAITHFAIREQASAVAPRQLVMPPRTA